MYGDVLYDPPNKSGYQLIGYWISIFKVSTPLSFLGMETLPTKQQVKMYLNIWVYRFYYVSP